MANSVSRRLIFMKVKARRPPRKPHAAPKTPLRDGDRLVGEAARPSAPFRATGVAVAAKKRRPHWKPILAWVAGLASAVGIGMAAINLAGQAQQPDTPVATASDAPAPGGYGRVSGNGRTGSGGATHAGHPVSTAEAFLAAPFQKRKASQITCSAPVVHNKESLNDFSRCLQQVNEVDVAPGGK